MPFGVEETNLVPSSSGLETWICTLKVVDIAGSSRHIVKFGKKVIKAVPEFKVLWTIPTTTYLYFLNLECKSATLETIGNHFLP